MPCKYYFTITLHSGVHLVCVYDHMTGRLDVGPDGRGEHAVEDHVWREAGLVAEHLEGNYFYISDVKNAFREAGIDRDQLDF